ncbi:MAG TPA: hypothetical protein DHW42_08605 [Candidatus Marinimicrobia bacterium]|nr:hypothetical protein [Candidatus Neomarinimicrobiota bacterium]
MEIFAPIRNYSIPEQSYKQFDSQIKDRQNGNPQPTEVEKKTSLKRGDSIPASKILSSIEMATLKTLFGFEKPEEPMFYGQSKVHQVQKGYLLDIIG